jgi:hypothetical protein
VIDMHTGEIVSRRFGVLAARCKSNGCPCCGPRNIKRNRKRALLGLREPGQVGLLTVTLDPAHPAYEAAVVEHRRADARASIRAGTPVVARDTASETALSVRFLGRGWSRFVTYARRIEPYWICECRRANAKTGLPAKRHEKGCTVRYRPLADLAYARGLELQRNGRAHIHAIVRVPDLAALFGMIERLRALADECGLGGRRRWRDSKGRLRSGFEVERASSRRAIAGYVTKAAGSAFAAVAGEVAKDRQARQLPPRSRRFAWTLGRRLWAPSWERPTADRALDWSLAHAGVATVTRALRASGLFVDPALLPGVVQPARPAERMLA